MRSQNYQDYANDKAQCIRADPVMTVYLLLTALLSPPELSVFYYSLSLGNNLLIVKQQKKSKHVKL